MLACMFFTTILNHCLPRLIDIQRYKIQQAQAVQKAFNQLNVVIFSWRKEVRCFDKQLSSKKHKIFVDVSSIYICSLIMQETAVFRNL